MKLETGHKHGSDVWVPYAIYDFGARFQYGRMMWRFPAMKSRLIRHWTNARHPYSERFAEQREMIEYALGSMLTPEELNQELDARGTSLRCVARDIPPVFGSFF